MVFEGVNMAGEIGYIGAVVLPKTYDLVNQFTKVLVEETRKVVTENPPPRCRERNL